MHSHYTAAVGELQQQWLWCHSQWPTTLHYSCLPSPWPQTTVVGPPLCCITLRATCNCLADHRHAKWSQVTGEWSQTFCKNLLHYICVKDEGSVEGSWDGVEISQSSCLTHDTRLVRIPASHPSTSPQLMAKLWDRWYQKWVSKPSWNTNLRRWSSLKPRNVQELQELDPQTT